MSASPRTEALAYRIWAAAEPLGWNVTTAELAAALDEDVRRVRAVLVYKKWSSRVRSSLRDIDVTPNAGGPPRAPYRLPAPEAVWRTE